MTLRACDVVVALGSARVHNIRQPRLAFERDFFLGSECLSVDFRFEAGAMVGVGLGALLASPQASSGQALQVHMEFEISQSTVPLD